MIDILVKPNKVVRTYQLSLGGAKKLTVTKLGKGLFKTVYGDTKSRRVFIISGSQEFLDYSTESLTLCQNASNPHIPKIEKIGYLGDSDILVYESIRYQMPLRKANTRPKQWEAYKRIKQAVDEAPGCQNAHDSSSRNYKILESLEGAIPIKIHDALSLIIGSISNYGSHFAMEISPRNVGTDSKGNLVFVDLFFDLEQVMKLRRSRHAQIN